MRLKLKEDPKEWRKFALTGCVVALLLGSFAWWRGNVSSGGFSSIAGGLALVAGAACWRAQWFRSPYRAAMTVSFRIGQVVGKVLLAVFFLFVLTPMALIMRMLGQDVLKLRHGQAATTYWQTVKKGGGFDRQF